MKFTIILLLSLIVPNAFSQIADINLLQGSWICYKAELGKTDMTAVFKDTYATFNSDFTYIEEKKYEFYYPCSGTTKQTNTIEGTYAFDQTDKKLKFKNIINTTKYLNSKVKLDNFEYKDYMLDEIIVLLDKDNLVAFLGTEKIPELRTDSKESYGGTKVYYKRQK